MLSSDAADAAHVHCRLDRCGQAASFLLMPWLASPLSSCTYIAHLGLPSPMRPIYFSYITIYIAALNKRRLAKRPLVAISLKHAHPVQDYILKNSTASLYYAVRHIREISSIKSSQDSFVNNHPSTPGRAQEPGIQFTIDFASTILFPHFEWASGHRHSRPIHPNKSRTKSSIWFIWLNLTANALIFITENTLHHSCNTSQRADENFHCWIHGWCLL